MKLVLEIDLAKIDGDPTFELGRALRYWGGAIKHVDLDAVQRQDIYDSSYAQPIGHWEILPETRENPEDHQHKPG